MLAPLTTALLPAGLLDLLPPEAETEAAAVGAVMDAFAGHGYQRIKPPLLEFEDSLFAGTGAAVADQTFRLMDPDTHRPMGLRADMTPQVARIAATRLGHAPRPLRLSYAGQCLRVRANPDRQVAQAGIELIGPDSPDADAELVVVGAEALSRLSLSRISFDLTMPPLVQALLEAAGSDPVVRAGLAHALDRKDAAAVARLGGPWAGTLTALLLAAGPVAGALAALAGAELPEAARPHAARLTATVAAIQARAPALRLTLDPVESRGFQYHTGVCSTIYAPNRHEELGRGGRYLCGSEPAAGLTLYPEAMLRAAGPRPSRARVWVPLGADPEVAAQLRAQGFATVAAFVPSDDGEQARHQSCTHVLRGQNLEALEIGR